MIEILLTNTKLKAIVDDDMEELLAFKWYGFQTRGQWYAKRTDRAGILLHHWIAGFPRPGLIIDHINGHGLDCRRLNLQYLTQSQNIAKGTLRSNSLAPALGVTQRKPGGNYYAHITLGRKYIHLGTFSTLEAAIAARQAAVRAYLEN